MKQELLLLLVVAIVWSVLAAVYALAPGLGMPGYARVWGGGAVVFLDFGRISCGRGERKT